MESSPLFFKTIDGNQYKYKIIDTGSGIFSKIVIQKSDHETLESKFVVNQKIKVALELQNRRDLLISNFLFDKNFTFLIVKIVMPSGGILFESMISLKLTDISFFGVIKITPETRPVKSVRFIYNDRMIYIKDSSLAPEIKKIQKHELYKVLVENSIKHSVKNGVVIVHDDADILDSLTS